MINDCFSISADARELILELRRFVAQKHASETLVPILHLCLTHECRDSEGRIIEQYLGSMLDIGWDSPDNEAFSDYPAVDLLGETLLVEPEAFELLKGKELIVETVEVGYPNPAEKTLQMLHYR
jgi:hypothetical protein